MKHVDEYRDAEIVKKLSCRIADITTRHHTIMEICGGQTHAIMKYSIEDMLPGNITIVHGPGCPVCVTPLEAIDRAVYIASMPDVILTSFGDMLRVPGSAGDLLSARSRGGDVRMVYSPLDAVRIAENNPDKKIVFFAVGFETTAPANAASVILAKRLGLKNYSILTSLFLVPPAISAILSSEEQNINAFLAAGHVCAVTGYNEYLPIASKYNVPVIVTGFEPVDILQGIYLAVKQLEDNRAEVENQYSRAVTAAGNIQAQKLMYDIFTPADRKWRGIGVIAESGLVLKDEYYGFDAEKIFSTEGISTSESPDCIAGRILRGLNNPTHCAAFGKSCTPEQPIGAPMVSGEGACAAYYHYRKG